MVKRILRKLPPFRGLVADKRRLQQRGDELEVRNHELAAQLESKFSVKDPRTLFSWHYLKGQGLEIGAAHLPLSVSPEAHVKYVDIAPLAEIKKRWPEVAKLDMVNIDIVDDAERLEKVSSASQDFVIANHFLEHCLHPIGALITFHRVLKPGGTLYMAIPDKRLTFDYDRPTTSYDHLLEEHKRGDKSFMSEHTQEYVQLAERHHGDIKKRTKELVDTEYRVHYHVWTQFGIMELLMRASHDFNLGLAAEVFMQNNNELLTVTRKLESAP